MESEELDLQEFHERAALARALPKDFGEGWMSKQAQDMMHIAAFAGFDMQDLTRRLAKLNLKKVQERHVLRTMDTLRNESGD